jgi:predicted RNase H-like nuclease
MKAAEAWPLRTSACDELIRRLFSLVQSDVPINLASHSETAALAEVSSPAVAAQYKKREDLLDAAICAWTAALWHRFGEERCEVLGVETEQVPLRPIASIIAPARREQRGGQRAPDSPDR